MQVINMLYIDRMEEFNQPLYLIEEQARQVMSMNTSCEGDAHLICTSLTLSLQRLSTAPS